MPITDRQREELCSFNNGQPFIITERRSIEGCDTFGVVLFAHILVAPTPEYTEGASFFLCFPPRFPEEQPRLWIENARVFHPNFTDNGEWMCSRIRSGESITDYLMRLVRTLEFREIDTECLANRNAMAWYNAQRQREQNLVSNSREDCIPRITIHRTNRREDVVKPRIRLGDIHYG